MSDVWKRNAIRFYIALTFISFRFSIAQGESGIRNNELSSLVTGALVGATFAGFATGAIPLMEEPSPGAGASTFLIPLGTGLLGAGVFYLTRDLLSPKWEKRLYKLSYMSVFGSLLCATSTGFFMHYLDEPREKRYYERTGDLSPQTPWFSIVSIIPALAIGGTLGYTYGYKFWIKF